MYEIFVVGGCGHAGLPLAVSFAQAGRRVAIYDINQTAVAQVRRGESPFLERGMDEALPAVLGDGTLSVADDLAAAAQAKVIVVAIATPVDHHGTPSVDQLYGLIEDLRPHLDEKHLLMIRSTVFPGTTERIAEYLALRGQAVEVAYCPERIAQGYALEEIRTLPQLVAGTTPSAVERATELFADLAPSVHTLSPVEAELGKLFTNTWRYLGFAVANQFYMLAAKAGADFGKIHHAISTDYPRAATLPRPGFSAGPCLLKDTLQLEAFDMRGFDMGRAARTANEGLPDFLVEQLAAKGSLAGKKCGILGMAFKANSDDSRGSLAYRLRRLLAMRNAEVLCSDVYIDEPGFVSASALIERSDVIFIGTPHKEYKDLEFGGTPVIDVWHFCANASR